MAESSGAWTEAQARRLLDAWAKSGLTVAEFARRERVRAQRLFWWRDRLGLARTRAASTVKGEAAKRTDAPKPSAETTFAPAMVKRAPRVTLAHPAAVVITVRSGRTIEIADATRVPPSWIGAVVRELERTR